MTTAETRAQADTMPTMRNYLAATSGFAAGKDSPRAFLERCLDAIGAWEPKIGAFVTLNPEGARKQADASAARWTSGKTLSPIDGMPVGIKDIIETYDMPTENGSPLYTGCRTERDAASVSGLRDAGAVIVGKTVTTEFAATQPRGTKNPWDTARTPGGSSSGSAASVATGLVSAALGTQVIGSIIRPASYCGAYGFKASIGGINRGGSHDGLSQSAHGVIAASLDECWQVAYQIVQRVGGDPGYGGMVGPAAVKPMKPRKLAFIETVGWGRATAGAKRAMEDALAALKAAGIEVVPPDHAKVVAAEKATADCRELSAKINEFELRWPLNTYAKRDVSKLSPSMVERLANGVKITLDDYRGMLADRAKARVTYAALAGEVDACVTLAAPGAAPLGLESTGDAIFTVPSSYLGIPAITLPVLHDEGLPLGLQIFGFEGHDDRAMAVAMAVDGLFPHAPQAAT